MASIFILNGPNLNLLGTRQPEVYGATTLADIQARCEALAADMGLGLSFMQSNHEGALVDAIHGAKGVHDGLVINAGAYTHTSVAILDAVLSVELPAVEVHLSNVHSREEFRHQSYLAKGAVGVIAGFGPMSYDLAIRALAERFS